jgi:hypothetical protein
VHAKKKKGISYSHFQSQSRPPDSDVQEFESSAAFLLRK